MACKKTSIGGQALIEGIMMRGPEKTAMAVRNSKGKIVLETHTNDTKVNKFFKLPIVRGVYGMITSFTTGYKYLMRSADISIEGIEEETNKEDAEAVKTEAEAEVTVPSETPEVTDVIDASDDIPAEPSVSSAETADLKDDGIEESVKAEEASDGKKKKAKKEEKSGENKALMAIISVIASVLGVALAIFLFVGLPVFIGGLIVPGDKSTLTFGQTLLRSVIEGGLKIVILVLYMWLVSFMKDIRRTFMYHGAEHKTIFCYEQGLPLTVENVRKQRRFHPRCGTSFLILMLLVSIIIGFFIVTGNGVLRFVIKLALLPIIVGIGYELIKFAGRHDNIVTKIISAPGVLLQHITTKEPTDDMIECAIAAMKEVIPEDSEKDNW